MPTSYTSLLGLALPVTGELSGVWGDTVNDYITNYLDGAVAGTQAISGSQTAVTLSKTTGSALTQAGSGATGSSQYSIINCTGNPAGMLTITAPAASKPYIVINATSTSQQVKLVGAGPTTGVTLESGERAVVAWNGSDFIKVATSTADGVTSISFGSTGLTPSTTTTGAVTVAGTLATGSGGTGLTSFTSGGAVYATSTSALTTGTLPVGSGGTGLTSGTSGGVPYFSASNTLASSAALAANALVVGGGAGVAPSTITTGTGVVTALGVNTGSAGAFVVNGGALGTPSSGTLTNATGLPLSTGVTGALSATNGGTGQTSYTDGQLLIGNTAGGLSKNTLTAGTGVSITNGNGTVTISATGSGGTVTSVSGTGTVNGITLTGTVTSTGSLTLGGTLSGVDLTTQVTGTLPVANGGTGLTAGTSGGVLYYSASGTLASSAALAANALVVGGGAGVAPSTVTTGTGVVTALGVNTGSAGAFVVNGGALGTPSSGTVTNLTGTASININGTVGATTPSTGVFTTAALSTDGSASAPAIFRSSDTNTGIFFPAADEIGFAVNGAEELRITSAGFTRPVAYADTVSALGNTGTAITIDCRNANVFTATLTGNCTFTLSNPIATGSSSFTLILTNDGTAGRTVAWSGGSFVFPGGAASLSRTTTANAVDVWVFFTPNGGTTWYGNIAMKNMTA